MREPPRTWPPQGLLRENTLHDMDAVITYVDGLDPQWRKDYSAFVGVTPEEKRFRDWGTLRYLLRGIQGCMPFVENVFLVVSSASQIPSWIDREQVSVVLHSDIIPAGLLPVFNSCTIEMFLHRIPSLAEEYLYFNDDMFPLLPCSREDFFPGGKAAIGFSRSCFAGNMYKKQCRVSDRLARKALGMKPGCSYVRPQHICSPMLRSHCEAAFRAVEEEIPARTSRLRTPDNANQYFFLDYLYYGGFAINRKISNKHLSQGVYSGERIAKFILDPGTKLACINDVAMSDAKYAVMREQITAAFEQRFPAKSRFEI